MPVEGGNLLKLVKCGCRGGGYSMISKDMLSCTNARTKGTCDNRLNLAATRSNNPL